MVDSPPCLGTYEPAEVECNGSKADPDPCTWRDRCGALKTYLRRSKQGIAKWLELEGWEIRRWCDQWIEAYEIEGGIPRVEREVVKVDLRAAFSELVAELPTKINWEYAQGRLALPGELYLVDRLVQDRYVAFYVRARQGHDRPVVRLQIKPLVGVVELRLPLGAPETAKALGVEAVAIRSGKFKARANLQADELEGVAVKIGALANSGALNLPARVIK